VCVCVCVCVCDSVCVCVCVCVIERGRANEKEKERKTDVSLYDLSSILLTLAYGSSSSCFHFLRILRRRAIGIS